MAGPVPVNELRPIRHCWLIQLPVNELRPIQHCWLMQVAAEKCFAKLFKSTHARGILI